MNLSDWRIRALSGAAVCVLAGSAFGDLSGFSNFAPVNNNAAGAGSYDAAKAKLTLTTGVGGQAASAFSATPQNVGAFNAYFTYTTTGGADGATFVLQNDPRGTAALGDGGGALGYGGTNVSFPAITNSVAQEFNLYTTSGEKFASNGATGTYNSTSPLTLSSTTTGVSLSYNGTDLKVTLANGSLYTHTYTGANIQSLVGPAAYVGFTGGTGGVTTTQSVSNFTFKSNPTPFLPIAVTGYNQDMIVEKSAPTTGNNVVSSSVTATLDNGTGKTGDTYFEQGYNTANTATGVPAAGSTFASASDFYHSFQMAPSYSAANNAILIDSGHTTGTFSIASPATYSALSLLTAGGNGAVTYTLTVHHTTGPDETIAGVTSPDWFNNSPLALNVGSRVADGATNPTIDAAGNNPRLYQVDVPLADTTDPVSSVDFTWTSGTGHAGLFALSGAAAVPEPACGALLGLGGLGLLARRRRRPDCG